MCAHQGPEEHVVADDLQQVRGGQRPVVQPGGGQRPVQAAVRGEVLVAAQRQRPVRGPGQLGGVVRVDLVQRPHRVEVADVAVVVVAVVAGPRPLGQRPAPVHPVRGQPPQQPRPPVRAGHLGGGTQGVPGGGDVHRGVHRHVHRPPPLVVRAGLRRVRRHHDHPARLVGDGEQVREEVRHLRQPAGHLPEGRTGDQVLLVQRVQQPVRAGQPRGEGPVLVQVEQVAVLAVGAAGRQQAPGPVDRPRVAPPVVDLAAYQVGVGAVTSGRAPTFAPASCRFRLASVVKSPAQAASHEPSHSPVSRGGRTPLELSSRYRPAWNSRSSRAGRSVPASASCAASNSLTGSSRCASGTRRSRLTRP